MLKLTASEYAHEGAARADIRVFREGKEIGALCVDHDDADELVGLLNAATELLHACNFMWRQAVMEGKTCSGDPNKPEYDRATAAIDVAEMKDGGG